MWSKTINTKINGVAEKAIVFNTLLNVQKLYLIFVNIRMSNITANAEEYSEKNKDLAWNCYHSIKVWKMEGCKSMHKNHIEIFRKMKREDETIWKKSFQKSSRS